jgi:hypothetical protein
VIRFTIRLLYPCGRRHRYPFNRRMIEPILVPVGKRTPNNPSYRLISLKGDLVEAVCMYICMYIYICMYVFLYVRVPSNSETEKGAGKRFSKNCEENGYNNAKMCHTIQIKM